MHCSENTFGKEPSQRAPEAVELTEDEILKGSVEKQNTSVEDEEDALAQFFFLAKDKSFMLQLPSRQERNLWFEEITAACK